jgi:GT2 family glycosyltransferase/glycosyltransferase involved in cell wall biosynthesis
MDILLECARQLTGLKNSVKVEKCIEDEPKVIGCIDAIEAGFVSGWALDPNTIRQNTYVSLEVDGKLYGRVLANEYRNDLEEAGISDGYNGFNIPLDEIIKEKSSHKIRLRVNNEIVNESSFKLKSYNGKFWCSVEKFENCHLIGSVKSEKFSGNTSIIIKDAGETIATFDTHLEKGSNNLSIPLPLSLFDDDYHLISVGVQDYPFTLWADSRKFTGILTPWHYLKNSYKESGFMGLSAQSKSRYESLRYQMDVVGKSNDAALELANILTAHDVVVKGWEGRKNFPKLTLPKFNKPEVSIIIPAYNKFELTYHSIASIILSYNKISFEVIVADDCSRDDTVNISDIIENVVDVKNAENLKFLRNCNNAVTYAKGDYIVMLNNDTEVTSYWLDELVLPFKQDKGIGLTGSKLLNTDGTLQEAGGIIWGSGRPWNVGSGGNPLAPEFNYTREVDYLTGAAMCISKEVWKQVDGFSLEYAPCYYEDTDIAFKVRDKGFKTVYCPMSQVVHFEGQSHGKDIKKGLKRYQEINESKFKAKWFKEYQHNGIEGVDLLLNKDRNVEHRVLVIDHATPDQHADAGSYAAIQEIKLLQKLGMKVTFVPESMAHMGKLSKELQRNGVEVLYSPFYSSIFDVIEKRIQEFDVIYITRYSVAEKYLASIRAKTQAKIVFNNADLHFLRELRAAGTTGEFTVEQALETRSKELAVMRGVDAILSYNETEHAVILSHNLRADNIFRCPWVLTDKEEGKSFSNREGIAFLGGFKHHPNIEAVKYFSEIVMPLLIEKEPDLKFYIYGANPSEKIEALASDNIIVVGFVKNLDEVFHNHKVIVAPLLSGAGVKGKVLEAMSYGAPQVLTSVAAEATGLSNKISAWINDDPKQLAEGVLELCHNEELWNKFSENSKIIVEEMYSEAKGVEMMRKVFEFVGLYEK